MAGPPSSNPSQPDGGAELVFSRELEPFDYLMFRGEHEPRSRVAAMSVALLDAVPDFDRLRTAFDRASRVALRLRQHVVVPTLPLAAPQWVIDPDFDLDFHLRRVALAGPGSIRHLLDFAQPLLAAPLDTARPLWEATLVEGIEEGEAKAALLLKLHHAITDGVGALAMFRELYDFECDTDRGPLPPLPVPEDLSPIDLARRGLTRLPISAISRVRGIAGGVWNAVRRVAGDPVGAVGDLGQMVSSAQRVLGSPPAPPSPLLRGRGLGRRFEVLEFSLDRFRKAAKSAGGSVNDAYIGAVCGVLRRYHEALGVPVEAVPLALPVNLRTDDDPAGGNRFAGARIAAPVGESDPVARIRIVRERVLAAVGEPAIEVLGAVAPVFALLPATVLSALSGLAATTDVQASNVPGYPEPPYLAGAKILKSLPFGPLPGVPMMIMLFTQAGTCHVGVHYDTAAVREQALFADCLRAGFEEVLALAPEPDAVPRPAAKQALAVPQENP